ncbi:MAG TPA: serine/threonine-protein kinase [Myxococcales bacterium]|jgi:serine/threonine-protein kinase
MGFPQKVGPHRIVRRLGHGGVAEVFLATAFGASGFERQVALKVLLPEHRGEAALEKALIEEGRLGGLLSHPNFVAVHDLGVDEGAYWLRMDYVDGADLGTVLGKGRLPPAEALFVAEELARGLAYLHALGDARGRPLGLVHRDVSPSNVLLSRQGEVKLADLGIAKATLLQGTTRGNVKKGKYAYMSPEQVSGRPLTGASDQFALGITLFQMLIGVRPFDGETPMETMDRIREAAPPKLEGVDADVKAIVLRCLAKAPVDRFPDAAALAKALAKAGGFAPVGAAERLAKRLRG